MSVEKPDNQEKSRDNLGRWIPGFSGNLKGRKPGKSLKEFTKSYLSKMTDKEKDSWLAGLPRETIWKMAEGNPKTDIDGAIEITKKVISVEE